MVTGASPPDSFLIISEKSLASRAIFPFSSMVPSTTVSMPSSMSLPVSLIWSVVASIRMHSKIGMVVLEETAFRTMLIPLSRSSFLNVSFINVDNSFAGSWSYMERKKQIFFVAIVVGAVNLCKTWKSF